MPDATWKRCERVVAARLGGERLSNHALGLRTPDVETEWLSIEVKSRKHLPAWLTDAMAQAVRNGDAAKLPAVVLHEVGRRHDNDLVVLRLGDFQDWFCGAEEVEAGAEGGQHARGL